MFYKVKKLNNLREANSIKVNNLLFGLVKQKLLAEKHGEVFNQEQYKKLFTPVIDTQKVTAQDVIKAIQAQPQPQLAIAQPPIIPAIEAIDVGTNTNKSLNFGLIANKYMSDILIPKNKNINRIFRIIKNDDRGY